MQWFTVYCYDGRWTYSWTICAADENDAVLKVQEKKPEHFGEWYAVPCTNPYLVRI